jgi:hypothetical protein
MSSLELAQCDRQRLQCAGIKGRSKLHDGKFDTDLCHRGSSLSRGTCVAVEQDVTGEEDL